MSKMFLFISGVALNLLKEKEMQCFMCKRPIQPSPDGFFKTDIWNKTLMCHVTCKPKFYWDNKPDEQGNQTQLFGEEYGTETTSKKPA